jgi:hypothetical protein
VEKPLSASPATRLASLYAAFSANAVWRFGARTGMRDNRHSADRSAQLRRNQPAVSSAGDLHGLRGTPHYPEMPLRCTRKKSLVLALLLAACGAPTLASAAAVADGLRVRLEPQSASASATHKIGIDGTAPAGCVPHIERVVLDGADLSIELAASVTGCKPQRPVPFHIQADPAVAAGLAWLTPQVYRVRVYGGSGTGAGLVAFSLIDTSASVLAPIPESGFWWSQSTTEARTTLAGSGLSLELQDNQLAASLLGFTDTGAATWYFGSTTLAGSVAKIPLVQLAHGDEWFSAIGARPDVQPGPRIEIEFLSPTRARAYLVRAQDGRDLDVRTLALSRSVFSTGPAGSAWIGRWVLVPEDGGSARVFDFSGPSSRDADSFRLVDAANDANLDCRLGTGGSQADACTLSSAASPLADFDQVGFDHLGGRDADGTPVQLLRVPR